MEIASNFEIAVANLAIALNDDAVSTEQRTEIAVAVGNDLDKMMEVVNAFVVANNAKMYEKKIDSAKAQKTIKAEYKAIGFEKIVEYRYLERLIALFYDRADFTAMAPARQVEAVREMFEQNRDCSEERVKVGIDSYALRILYNFGLVAEDIEFTKQLMRTINAYNAEQRDKALIPPAIVTEL